jgi:elongation factor P--(R)-beta-lysine ligase
MSDPIRRERFLPTTAIDTLKARARLLAVMRQVFDTAGFFEVETPVLSADIVVDAWLEPFIAEWIPAAELWTRGGEPRFLQTSPEFAMKRLIAAGADSIYQLGKVFRNGEFGRYHNPEFTMLEWYRTTDDLSSLMTFTEVLVQRVFSAASELVEATPRSALEPLRERVLDPRGFERLSYQDAFLQQTGCPVLNSSMAELHAIARRHQLVPPPGLEDNDRDGWLNFLLSELIEPALGHDRPTFLTNYPASQAALARLSADGQTAERFELYIQGIELCNGYDELTDASALRTRIREQAALRTNAGLRPLPDTSRLLTAMEAGLPPCSGNALGVDRLIMLALGRSKLAEVIPFPFDIA